MRILIAPDSFKGSLSALEVAKCMARGALRVFPHAHCDCIPMADGGEGTVAALVEACGGDIHSLAVQGPLGDVVDAFWGILSNGSAVIEMAAASGLPLVEPARRNPCLASSYGTGQLIDAALEMLHAKKTQSDPPPQLIIGIGGSATNDGGTGALSALGIRFLDQAGTPLPPGGAALSNLASIDTTSIHPLLAQTDILIACDVDTPLCGEAGASAIFGPQKGATPEMVQQLDAALTHYAAIATRTTGKDIALSPGAGAAGGLGAGLLFFANAKLRPGIELVLEASKFDERARLADLVLTGEGHTDAQTARGKTPLGVAQSAKKYSKPVICISGGLAQGASALLPLGIDAITAIPPAPMRLEECMEQAADLLEDATERTCRLLAIGNRLSSLHNTANSV